MMTEQQNYSPERLDAMDLVSQAHMLINAENYAAAAALLDEAEQKDAMYLPVYIEQGNLHIIQDDYKRAMERYEKGLLIDKNNGELHFHIGNVLLLEEQYGNAVTSYAKAEELGFDNSMLVENMAYCYEQTNQLESALSAYLRAIRMDPENPMPRLRRIQLQVSMGSMESARNATDEFIRRFPNLREGYEVMTDILIQNDEAEKAETFLSEALEAYTDSSALMVQLSRVYAIQDRYDEALALLAKARTMEDVTEGIKSTMDEYEAHLLLLKQDIDGALAVYQRIIDNEGGEINVQARLTQLNLLSTFKRYDELLKAASSAQKTSECDGPLCLAYVMEPLALENLGRLSEAKPLYENAIRKLRLLSIQDSSHVDTYLYRAMCYRGLGDYDSALKQLKFYDDMGIENAELNEYKAQIYEAMGDTKQANKAKAEAARLREHSRHMPRA